MSRLSRNQCAWYAEKTVAYRDFSGQACNDEMMTSSVSKFSSILIFDKTVKILPMANS